MVNDEHLLLLTSYDQKISPSVNVNKKGLIINFSRMNKIERIDTKNLIVHIQRGVTFEQIIPELKKVGVKLNVPAAASSKSVVEQYVNRVITMRAARYPEVHVTNMKVVLPDGSIHLTGSHALSEESSDHKADGGPDLSKWYLGAEDMYGIVTRASIWLYPYWDTHKILAFGCNNREDATDFIKDIPRRDLCTMGMALNTKVVAENIKPETEKLPEWTAVVSVEGNKEIADYREKTILDLAKNKNLNNISNLYEDKYEFFEKPLYINDLLKNTGFYCTFDRINEFESIIKDAGYSQDACSQYFVSVANGSCVYFNCDFQDIDMDSLINLELALSDHGAFFDRPQGKLAESIYRKLGKPYLAQIQRIKKMVDPGTIINPGIPVTIGEEV